MHTQVRRPTAMQDAGGGAQGPSWGGVGSGIAVGLVALACPLLCLGPLLLAGLATTGLVRAVVDAPWPPIAGAVLVTLALGFWGMRDRARRGPETCCAPTRRDLLREGHDESAS